MNVTPEKFEKLRELAAANGVQTSYKSAFGHVQEIPPEGLAAVLNAVAQLGLKPDLSNVDAALKKAAASAAKIGLAEPIAVFWEGRPAEIVVRGVNSGTVKFDVKLESGETFSVERDASELLKCDGGLLMNFNRQFPFGYHQITVTAGKAKQKILVISSPWIAYQAPSKKPRFTGVFAPLYAVHSKNSWGIGDFSDLERLTDWAYSMGCEFVGTLPMLSIFNDKPMVEPSPYSPLSRTFWNELYVDPRRAAEWSECKKAQKIASSAPFKKKLAALQKAKQVDYQAVSRLKRPVMEAMAEHFFAKGKDKSREYREFLKLYPTVESFAEFRAVGEKRNAVWRKWPERMRNGTLKKGDFAEKDKRYHLYAQFLAHQQLAALSESSKGRGRGLYIDFPLSAHADGFDIWRERDSFGQTASAGCPPDPAHVHGQDWGILPLNPQSIRKTGYRYFRNCLEVHMRYAGLLRLDHVMCFYRLYWVPHGLGAKNGAYVRYNLDEFFALLVLESHRNQCTLIGEDLGTVPPEIREAMDQHKILRMYVQQRRLAADAREPLAPVPENSICSLNTHDMPPFAAYWKGLDVVDKMKLGYFPRKELPAKKAAREELKSALVGYLQREGLLNGKADIQDIFRAMMVLTAKGPAQVMQVNLEDLWGETLSQNVPGTWKERPNWRRKCKYGVDQLGKLKNVPALFEEIGKLRD